MSGGLTPLVRWMARAAAGIFYRVERVGPLPPAGPLLLLPNHPNALLDPAVVWATAGRDIRFLAKSTLFDGPFGAVLRAGGAIPVYRRIDQDADVSRNAEMFAAVHAALAAGDAICIFPEGISHSSGRLEPLRTGAARMAIASEQGGTPVALVAVGLNFDRKTVFRSRVTIAYGAPFGCGDIATSQGNRHEMTQMVTERIADHMRDLIVEAEPSADGALVDRVDRLYAAARGRPADPRERIERRQVIADGIAHLRGQDRERYESILIRIRRYDQRLRRFGLHDRHLDWVITPGDAWRFALRELALAPILLPLSAAGLVLFFVPYHATAFVARRFTKDSDVIATAQLFSGAAIYAAWILLLAAAVFLLFGKGALLTFLALPLVAIVSLKAIERESDVIESTRAWWILRRARGRSMKHLRQERAEVADLLDEVREVLR